MPSVTIGKCSVQFEFSEFSKLPLEIGRPVFSPVLKIMGKRWRLCLYPGGRREKHSSYVSCYLQCLSAGSTTISFTLSLINQRLKRPCNSVKFEELTRTFEQTESLPDDSKTHGGYGTSHFVLRSVLNKRASDLLANDTLVVRLDMSTTPSMTCPVKAVNYDLTALLDYEETTDLDLEVVVAANGKSSDGGDDRRNSKEESDGNEGSSSSSSSSNSAEGTNNNVEEENGGGNNDSSVVFRTHKLVLSAFSEVFKTMFYGHMQEASSSKLVIDDFSVEAVECMLDFCYNGDVDLEGYSEALEVLALSCKYQMNALTSRCVTYLMEALSEDNAIEILDVANTLSLKKFKETVMEFIVNHPSCVNKGAYYLNACNKELLVEIMLKTVPAEKAEGRKRNFDAI